MPDPRLKTYAPQAVRHLAAAGDVLAERQETVAGPARATSPPGRAPTTSTSTARWRRSGSGRGTSGCRARTATRRPRGAAWAFVETQREAVHSRRASTAPSATRRRTTARWPCSRARPSAALGELGRQAAGGRRPRARACWPITWARWRTCRGREFSDPGFLAYALAEYARAVDDRGLLAGAAQVRRARVRDEGAGAVRGRAGGGRRPVRFLVDDGDADPGGDRGGGGDAVRRRVAARARGGQRARPGSSPRRLDENTWNACVAWALGRAYVVSTDPVFMQAYSDMMDELERRDSRPRRRAAARPDGAARPRRRRRSITRWPSTRW